MKTKRLLLLFTTTGYNAEDFARAAQKLGVEVVFGTDRCRVLKDPWRDAAFPLRFHRPVEAARLVRKYAVSRPIDAVIAVGDKPTVASGDDLQGSRPSRQFTASSSQMSQQI